MEIKFCKIAEDSSKINAILLSENPTKEPAHVDDNVIISFENVANLIERVEQLEYKVNFLLQNFNLEIE